MEEEEEEEEEELERSTLGGGGEEEEEEEGSMLLQIVRFGAEVTLHWWCPGPLQAEPVGLPGNKACANFWSPMFDLLLKKVDTSGKETDGQKRC